MNTYLPTLFWTALLAPGRSWRIQASVKVLVPRKSRTLVKLPAFNMGLTCGEKAIFIFGAVRCRE